MSGHEVLSRQPLRIAIDGEALRTPLSGVGRYVFHIGRALETLLPQAEFLVYARGPAAALALPSARWTPRLESNPRLARLPSMAWLKWRSPRLIRADRPDVYWAGRSLMPALPAGVPGISTVHDLNGWVVPETMPFKHRWAHRFWFGADVRRAARVVCNSQGTADRLMQLMQVRTHAVVPPGLEPCFDAHDGPEPWPEALQATGLRPPYLLAVATLEPRKNLSTLLQAFVAMKQAGELPQHQLALVGSPGWGEPGLQAALAAARPLGVISTGYLPDGLLPVLYRQADALVFPSIYEGFGMPVLEARACGTRVVVSDVPELREVAGADGVVVPPTAEGIRAGVLTALQRPRPATAGLAEAHAWSVSARQMGLLILSIIKREEPGVIEMIPTGHLPLET